MEDVQTLMRIMENQKGKPSCEAFRQLMDMSLAGCQVYPFFEVFVKMMDAPNSLVRNKGLLLVASNAAWDDTGRIEAILDKYFSHLSDEKPITARQCIKGLGMIARTQPHLREKIGTALAEADFSGYPESMRSLLQRDVASFTERA